MTTDWRASVVARGRFSRETSTRRTKRLPAHRHSGYRSTVHCKLADFGRGVAAAAQRAAAGSRYAAPELLCDQADVQPSKCDAWSYGTCLLELLSGKPPWDEVETKELVARAASGVAPPPPPLPDAADVSAPELLDLARRCLTVDAAARPQFKSSEDLQAHLDNWLLRAAVAAPAAATGEADVARKEAESAKAELAKVKQLLAEEQRKDSDAYARAWDDCVRDCGEINHCADASDLGNFVRRESVELIPRRGVQA